MFVCFGYVLAGLFLLVCTVDFLLFAREEEIEKSVVACAAGFIFIVCNVSIWV